MSSLKIPASTSSVSSNNNNNNNNNTNTNDESNNNSSSPTLSTSPDIHSMNEDSSSINTLTDVPSTSAVAQTSNGTAGTSNSTTNGNGGLKASIIGGLRWEELTEMGHRIMADGETVASSLGSCDDEDIEVSTPEGEIEVIGDEKLSYLTCEDKLNASQYSLEGSDSCSSTGARPKRRPMLQCLDPKVQEQIRKEKLKDLKIAASKVQLTLKSQFSNKPPNLCFPKKINPADYTEEVSLSFYYNE